MDVTQFRESAAGPPLSVEEPVLLVVVFRFWDDGMIVKKACACGLLQKPGLTPGRLPNAGKSSLLVR